MGTTRLRSVSPFPLHVAFLLWNNALHRYDGSTFIYPACPTRYTDRSDKHERSTSPADDNSGSHRCSDLDSPRQLPSLLVGKKIVWDEKRSGKYLRVVLRALTHALALAILGLASFPIRLHHDALLLHLRG